MIQSCNSLSDVVVFVSRHAQTRTHMHVWLPLARHACIGIKVSIWCQFMGRRSTWGNEEDTVEIVSFNDASTSEMCVIHFIRVSHKCNGCAFYVSDKMNNNMNGRHKRSLSGQQHPIPWSLSPCFALRSLHHQNVWVFHRINSVTVSTEMLFCVNACYECSLIAWDTRDNMKSANLITIRGKQFTFPRSLWDLLVLFLLLFSSTCNDAHITNEIRHLTDVVKDIPKRTKSKKSHTMIDLMRYGYEFIIFNITR